MRILLATPPKAETILRRALGNAATLLPAFTLAQALSLATRGVDIIVCGIHFDGARMFDFLRAVKADPRTNDTPFVCVHVIGMRLAPALVQSLEISCGLLGAAKFVDLYALDQHLVPEAAERELGRVILAAAAATPPRSDWAEPPIAG